MKKNSSFFISSLPLLHFLELAYLEDSMANELPYPTKELRCTGHLKEFDDEARERFFMVISGS